MKYNSNEKSAVSKGTQRKSKGKSSRYGQPYDKSDRKSAKQALKRYL